MAGLCNRHLNSNREYAYANDLEIRMRVMNVPSKEYGLGGPGLVMGGISFAWLAVWVLSPDCICRKLGVCDFFEALR